MNLEYEIKPQEKLSLGIKELWSYKELFYFFTWRDIKVKYKQTILGFVWAILQPLIMMLIFTFFFGKTLNIDTGNIPYPVFVYSGLLLWNIFSNGLSSAGNSMVNNANIIKKIYFPRLIIPISSILVALFDFFMSLIVFIGIIIYYKIDISIFRMLVFFPISIILATISCFGPGCLLAALNVKYRDVRYVIPFLIQVLLFLTPVIYPTSIVQNIYIKYLMAINPMTAPINLFRHAVIGKEFDANIFLISTFSSIVLFIIGIYYFRKTEAFFADLA
jgi:lipopolysaccharide transport system permease protein